MEERHAEGHQHDDLDGDGGEHHADLAEEVRGLGHGGAGEALQHSRLALDGHADGEADECGGHQRGAHDAGDVHLADLDAGVLDGALEDAREKQQHHQWEGDREAERLTIAPEVLHLHHRAAAAQGERSRAHRLAPIICRYTSSSVGRLTVSPGTSPP